MSDWQCTTCGRTEIVAPGQATFDPRYRKGYCVSCRRHDRIWQAVPEGPALVSVPPPPPARSFERGIQASETAALYAWTPFERYQVDEAITAAARVHPSFTADAVWLRLGPRFPVTKGLAGRLMAAKGRGIIEPTGEVTFSQRQGEHGHGQRLAVWRSLIHRP